MLKLVLYTGPALIVSMAYIDPGNYGTDIQAGASLNYSLLWVVWLSSGMAMLLQYLSGKIGIATGLSLPEIIREKLKKKRKTYVITYWLAAETAVAATDLAEYLGTVIALNLLFGIPMIYAAIFHIIEKLFAFFVSLIGFGYLYEIIIINPDPSAILYHSFVPSLGSTSAIILAVGVIGATVMPHALFVHSWLTKNKVQNKSLEERKKIRNSDWMHLHNAERRKIRKLHLIENVVLLTVAGVINAAIMIMAAAAFHSHSPNVASISEAYKTLVPLFGATAGIVFLITLLSSGIASSVTGTLAGQAIMEGLLGKKVNVWLRRFITRFINVIPTTIAILLGLDPLNILVYSQVILSLMIPLPMIPLVILSADKTLMSEFVNRKITTTIAIIFAGIILVFNSYLLVNIK